MSLVNSETGEIVVAGGLAALEEAAVSHYDQGQTSLLALANDLAAMHEHRSTREIAKWAKSAGLERVASQGRVVHLCQWAELVHAGQKQGVITAVITPSERTLRPLFAKRLDIDTDGRIDLLADAYRIAATEGTALTSRHVVAAVDDVHPPAPPKHKGKEHEAKALRALDDVAKPGAATRYFASWRRNKRTPMSTFEAYNLCELIIAKAGSLDKFVEMVVDEQARQQGLPDLLEPGRGVQPRPGGMGDRTAHQE